MHGPRPGFCRRFPAIMPDSTVFLLSPALASGKRAGTLMNPSADFDLARRFRSGSATLGEVFAFVSGLYFRGKLAYAEAFARAPEGSSGVLVITAGRGLLESDVSVGPHDLEEFARVPVDPTDERYAGPLRRDAERVAEQIGNAGRAVLLGSIATDKYVGLLGGILGERLCFPEAFVGMGDMQRGAMLLRAAECESELEYVRVEGAVRSRARSKTESG